MSAEPDGAQVSALYTFPIKGLSGAALESVALEPGRGFPHDRTLAFARAATPFDEAAPAPLRKTMFHMLAKDASLARLSTRYDPDTEALTIAQDGRSETYDLGTAEGADAAAARLAEAMSLAKADRPRLVRGGTAHRFTDVSVVSQTFMNAISLVNLASVREIGARAGAQIDPLRFRANVLLDGWPPFHELALEGSTLRLGEATVRVLLRTERCAATTVNPQTGQRDVFVPRLLLEAFGHADCGIYCEVLDGGTLRPGDAISIL